MNKEELRQRTKEFGLRVMKLVDVLPNGRSANAVANQLVRSGTAIGANYRAACRGRSTAEFMAKIGIVVEEADESAYWLELITEANLLKSERVAPLLIEASELLAIFSSAHASLRRSASIPKRKAVSRSRMQRTSAKSRNPEIQKSRNP